MTTAHLPLELRIAEVAHDCWKQRLQAAGWQLGSFDPARLRHDSLVPFEALSAADRQRAVALVMAADANQYLAGLIDYPRGAGRPFTLEEMKVGLPVRWSPATKLTDEELRAARLGQVTAWQTHQNSGGLAGFTVKWDNGLVTEHDPLLSDLERAETDRC